MHVFSPSMSLFTCKIGEKTPFLRYSLTRKRKAKLFGLRRESVSELELGMLNIILFSNLLLFFVWPKVIKTSGTNNLFWTIAYYIIFLTIDLRTYPAL